jgi:4-aminobutyrate aminotransferase-like enzyme
VLRILGFDEDYISAQGSYLYGADGRRYLDFHTGEGSRASATTTRRTRSASGGTRWEPRRRRADPLLGARGHAREALSARLPKGLDAVFFANTGAEAVDSAMKFARAATGRPRLSLARAAFTE